MLTIRLHLSHHHAAGAGAAPYSPQCSCTTPLSTPVPNACTNQQCCLSGSCSRHTDNVAQRTMSSTDVCWLLLKACQICRRTNCWGAKRCATQTSVPWAQSESGRAWFRTSHMGNCNTCATEHAQQLICLNRCPTLFLWARRVRVRSLDQHLPVPHAQEVLNPAGSCAGRSAGAGGSTLLMRRGSQGGAGPPTCVCVWGGGYVGQGIPGHALSGMS